MELGCAKTIGVKQFGVGVVDTEMNRFLEDHPNLEILDIKYSASSTPEDWAVDAHIVYRKVSGTVILW
ncbi:hypothetical protein ACK2WG_16965 [Bacillus spizizenii]|uniref:hypothetical protein n=1 Tax=Bacillus spizizenii TaxID=96241 RepID=UPI00391815E3